MLDNFIDPGYFTKCLIAATVTVEFPQENGTTIRRLIGPEVWTVDLPGRTQVLSRRQIPLVLSYAMSIHKAQGQSLDRVLIDLGRIFEKGQSYVALSRAKTPQNLQVLGFERSKVFVHPKVLEFHRHLEYATKSNRYTENNIKK